MRFRTSLAAVWLLFLAVISSAQPATLAPPEQLADGALLYRLDDPELLNPPGPVAVQALRLDPRKVTLEIGRGAGAEPPRTTVDVIAERRPGAIAAINAGFFSLETGRPTNFLKIGGKVVSGTSRPRGAVGITARGGVTTLLFDRLAVTGAIKGPLEYKPLLDSSPRDWARAQHAVSGAGLLMLDGRELTEWKDERISVGFDTTRHPRTLIGTDGDGYLWLITVDGRNLSISLGMSFTELQRLSKRLGLRSVLNLDGGGSTTMWAAGKIVNHPSDPGGPRPVSDAIVAVPRKR
jgi:exopolysaccharide biosynthesis protein